MFQVIYSTAQMSRTLILSSLKSNNGDESRSRTYTEDDELNDFVISDICLIHSRMNNAHKIMGTCFSEKTFHYLNVPYVRLKNAEHSLENLEVKEIHQSPANVKDRTAESGVLDCYDKGQ